MLGYLLIFGAVLMTVTTERSARETTLEGNEELGNENLGEDASVEEIMDTDSEEVEMERG